MTTPHAQGTIHLKARRRLGDREHLLQAESSLKEIGAEFDIPATQEDMEKLLDV